MPTGDALPLSRHGLSSTDSRFGGGEVNSSLLELELELGTPVLLPLIMILPSALCDQGSALSTASATLPSGGVGGLSVTLAFDLMAMRYGSPVMTWQAWGEGRGEPPAESGMRSRRSCAGRTSVYLS